jgi:hypothetical protein
MEGVDASNVEMKITSHSIAQTQPKEKAGMPKDKKLMIVDNHQVDGPFLEVTDGGMTISPIMMDGE